LLDPSGGENDDIAKEEDGRRSVELLGPRRHRWAVLAALLEGSAAVNAFAGISKSIPSTTLGGSLTLGWIHCLTARVHTNCKGRRGTRHCLGKPCPSTRPPPITTSPSAMGRRPTSFLGSAVRDTPAGSGPNEGGAPPSARSSTKELTGFFVRASLHKMVDRCPRQQR